MGDSDFDQNLCFRWDIYESDIGGFCMDIFILQQGGIFNPVHIESVTDLDVDQIVEYLENHLKHLLDQWSPLDVSMIRGRKIDSII